jgi:hypothetical protein
MAKFLPFEEAREYVRAHSGAKTKTEYKKWASSGKRPDFVPSQPELSYKNKGWKGWGDWLGTFTIAPQNIIYWQFKKAREWRAYTKSGKKPPDIPANPYVVYKEEWKRMGDWLGTGTVASGGTS